MCFQKERCWRLDSYYSDEVISLAQGVTRGSLPSTIYMVPKHPQEKALSSARCIQIPKEMKRAMFSKYIIGNLGRNSEYK